MHLTSKKTPKVRTTFSIPQDSFDVLARFADVSGVSRSHILTEVLEFVSPVLSRLSDAIESGDEAEIQKINDEFLQGLGSLKEPL